MDDSSAILCQISSLKDMLDQVNEEVEANFQITRQIESEIVNCSEFETNLKGRESELMKTMYMSQFEIQGLMSVTSDSRRSVKGLKGELHSLELMKDEILQRINNNREAFTKLCLGFQEEIGNRENSILASLLSEKEYLQNEIGLMNKSNLSLENSLSDFVQDILEDLNSSNTSLQVEIECRKIENEKLVSDINELKTTLISAILPYSS